jgi:hypothetical protein
LAAWSRSKDGDETELGKFWEFLKKLLEYGSLEVEIEWRKSTLASM